MDLQFFLICFGVLGCYAVLRTTRHGLVRGLVVFCLAMCIVKIAFDAMLPVPQTIAQPSISLRGVHRFFATEVAGLADDRCIMAHLQDTPLGPLAYMVQARRFLETYKKAQASGAPITAISQAASATFGPAPAAPGEPQSLCDQFDAWMQTQAQASVQNAVSAVRGQ